MGTMERLVLSDQQRERIAAHIIGDSRTRGSSGHDSHMFVDAVLRIARTGARWRDLPDLFGSWNAAFPSPSNSEGSRHDTRNPPESAWPSSLLLQSYSGSGKCPKCLGHHCTLKLTSGSHGERQ